MICMPTEKQKLENYHTYKAGKFKRTKDKVKLMLNGIEQTSLRPKDRELLLKQIKELVSKF